MALSLSLSLPLSLSITFCCNNLSFLRSLCYRPCILIFDSLADYSGMTHVIGHLRQYLRIEYKTKYGEDRDFSENVVKGSVPSVPQQSNLTDCGLFVLQYAESFFHVSYTQFYALLLSRWSIVRIIFLSLAIFKIFLKNPV